MTRFERWSVWTTSVATAVTGFVYMGMQYLLTPANQWDVINHPLQPLVLKLHILVAPLLVFAVGLITMRHVWRHFLSGTGVGRRSGVTTAIVLGPMVFTGYLIQAVTDVGLLRAMVWGHILTGTLYIVALLAHQVMIRRRLVREREGAGAAAASRFRPDQLADARQRSSGPRDRRLRAAHRRNPGRVAGRRPPRSGACVGPMKRQTI